MRPNKIKYNDNSTGVVDDRIKPSRSTIATDKLDTYTIEHFPHVTIYP